MSATKPFSLKSPRFPPYIGVAGSHLLGGCYVPQAIFTQRGWKEAPPHTLDKYDFMVIKACLSGKRTVQHAGDTPSNFFFWLFYFFV